MSSEIYESDSIAITSYTGPRRVPHIQITDLKTGTYLQMPRSEFAAILVVSLAWLEENRELL